MPKTVQAPFAQTFLGRLTLVAASLGLLSLSFAPVNQFYLAWVGLAPWLVLVAHTKSKKAAFFWSWLTGILFFSINIWWIGYVTIPGAMGLMLYMGLWFGIAGLVLRGAGLLKADGARPLLSIALIAAVWVATEWTWGNLFTGLPWLYLGHTQTPLLVMCQIADFSSTFGVTFWVVLINAWVAFLILHRWKVKKLIVPGITILVLLAAVLGYGIFRMGQKTLYAGPRVMVVQPNFPQDPSGSKGASIVEMVGFHLKTTRSALERLGPEGKPDLIVWSETMMPPMNPEYLSLLRQDPQRKAEAEFYELARTELARLAVEYQTTVAAGTVAMVPDSRPTSPGQRFNSVYVFEPSGEMVKERYDKIHLVPFGEFIPFKTSFPPLYRFFNLFNPGQGDYEVTQGKSLTVFTVNSKPWRFVTPICFEDVDSSLVARLIRGEKGGKRADFLINATNDGWFATPQMQQHLQLATFRCIENRVPAARSVNTGVSGFIDSVGRAHDLIPVGTVGTQVAQLDLDHRVAPYTHLGDLFAGACVVVAGGMIVLGLWNRMKNRKSARR